MSFATKPLIQSLPTITSYSIPFVLLSILANQHGWGLCTWHFEDCPKLIVVQINILDLSWGYIPRLHTQMCLCVFSFDNGGHNLQTRRRTWPTVDYGTRHQELYNWTSKPRISIVQWHIMNWWNFTFKIPLHKRTWTYIETNSWRWRAFYACMPLHGYIGTSYHWSLIFNAQHYTRGWAIYEIATILTSEVHNKIKKSSKMLIETSLSFYLLCPCNQIARMSHFIAHVPYRVQAIIE